MHISQCSWRGHQTVAGAHLIRDNLGDLTVIKPLQNRADQRTDFPRGEAANRLVDGNGTPCTPSNRLRRRILKLLKFGLHHLQLALELPDFPRYQHR